MDRSEFVIILAGLPSITTTQELVVPKSIPVTETSDLKYQIELSQSWKLNDHTRDIYLCLTNSVREIRLENATVI